MSISQLFFKQANIIGDADTGIIEFDVVESESARSRATVTQNPVESGADVTDHMRMEPMEFSLTGIVSNTPVIFLGGIQAGNLTVGNKQSIIAWDKLLELQSKRQPFTLVQGLKSYDNVIIEDLQQITDTTTSNALRFTANMKEVIFVGVQELEEFNFDEPPISAGMIPTSNDGLKDL